MCLPTEEVGTKKKKTTLFTALDHTDLFVSAANIREKHKVAPLWSLFSPLYAFQVNSYSRPIHDRELTVTSSQESQLATWLGQTSLSLPRAVLGPEILQIILYLSVFDQLARPALLVLFVHRSSEEKGDSGQVALIGWKGRVRLGVKQEAVWEYRQGWRA